MIDIETRYGKFRVPDAQHDLIGRFLQRYGEWACNEVRFVAAALGPAPARVLDIGAFVGTFGIGLSAERAVSSLVMVEANSQVAPALLENVRRNARAPTVVVEAVVAPAGLELAGAVDPQNLGSLAFVPAPDTENRVAALLPSRRLSLTELRQEHGDFDLIKMDVEGLEHIILAADSDVLLPGGPAFWLECNEDLASLVLADLLLSAGLSVHYFAFPAFAPDNFRGDQEPIFPFAFEAGLWASRGPAPTLATALAEQGCILRTISCREDLRTALWETPRWGMVEWQHAPATTMVAIAAHALREEEYSHFLVSTAAAARDRASLERALRHAEELLAQEHEELCGIRVVLDDERERVIKLRDQLRAQKAIADVQTALAAQAREELCAIRVVLDDERERVIKLQDQLRAQKAIADVQTAFAAQAREQLAVKEAELTRVTDRIKIIEGSTSWRMIAIVRAFFAGRPRTGRLLRGGLNGAYRLCSRGRSTAP